MQQHLQLEEKEQVEWDKEDSESIIAYFFNSDNGAYIGIFGVLFGGISLLIGYILYVSVDPSYSLNTHFISDLGVRPNGAAYCFAIGVSIMCEHLLFYHIYEIRRAQELKRVPLLKYGIWLGALFYSIGGYIAAIFPVTHEMHAIGAFFYFLGAHLFYGGFVLFFMLGEYDSPLQEKLYSIIFIGYLLYSGLALISSMYPEILDWVSIYLVEWLTLLIHLPALFLRCIGIIRENKERDKYKKSQNGIQSNLKNDGEEYSETSERREDRLDHKPSSIKDKNIVKWWNGSPNRSKPTKKPMVLIFFGLIGVLISIYIGAIIVFIEPTLVYRLVLEWVILPVFTFQFDSHALEGISAEALEQQAALFNFLLLIICALLLLLFLLYYKLRWSK